MKAKQKKYKIAIGSDHAGFSTKQKVIKYLKMSGHTPADFGPDSEDSVDYPDYAKKVALGVSKNKYKFGILICGSGIGMCMAANKVKNIRAANNYNKETAEMSRCHNDANVLCLGARMLTMSRIKTIIKTFLTTDFEGGRHQRRVKKIK